MQKMTNKTQNNTITLFEFDYIQFSESEEKNHVTKKEFETIKKFVFTNEEENRTQFLKLATKKGREVLQAQNYVGVIKLKKGRIIEILPKIGNNKDKTKPKQILLKMLKTLKDFPFKSFEMANLKTENIPLLEIFISMFIEETFRLIKKGIKNDYILQEKNQNFLKGKLKFQEQIKYNFVHKERFFVAFDEYLPNRIENKIIKTTLLLLNKFSNNPLNKKNINKLLFVFDEISPLPKMNFNQVFKNLKTDRTIKHYENTLLWSKIFLTNQSFTPYTGNEIAFALLFDMNKLFESYVGKWFRKKIKNFNVKLQDSLYYLFEEQKKWLLKPDIVLKNSGTTIVLDTKWKILNCSDEKLNISQSDLYQMFAYLSKYKDCKEACLIYPYIEGLKPKRYKTKICNKEAYLNIIFFELKEKEDKLKVNNHLEQHLKAYKYP